MKSLYFQTVGIECKLYENQQLEYRLYSWGQSVFEKLFPQSARPTPRYILPEFSCRSPLRRLYCDIHLAENLFQTRSIGNYYGCFSSIPLQDGCLRQSLLP